VSCPSAISVAHGPPIIGGATRNPTSCIVSPTYQLKQIWSSNLPQSIDSTLSTPLCCNRASVKTSVVQPEKVLSPINCTRLLYTAVDSSLNGAQEISPVVIRTQVPKGYSKMDDDFSLLEYPDSEVEGDESSLNDASAPDTIEPAVLVQVEGLDLNDMAKLITDDAMDPNISEEELKLIMSSSVNTEVYEKSCTGVESRFFDTIDKYGGDTLKPLVMFADDSFMKERVFYIKLRGDRSEFMRFILNKCLGKIALK
jgi:hypothetical protein